MKSLMQMKEGGGKGMEGTTALTTGEDKKIYTDHRYIRIKVPGFISVKHSSGPQYGHKAIIRKWKRTCIFHFTLIGS